MYINNIQIYAAVAILNTKHRHCTHTHTHDPQIPAIQISNQKSFGSQNMQSSSFVFFFIFRMCSNCNSHENSSRKIKIVCIFYSNSAFQQNYSLSTHILGFIVDIYLYIYNIFHLFFEQLHSTSICVRMFSTNPYFSSSLFVRRLQLIIIFRAKQFFRVAVVSNSKFLYSFLFFFSLCFVGCGCYILFCFVIL